MIEDLIQLPELAEVKELLVVARRDIETEVKEDPELLDSSKLLIKVIDIIEEKIAKGSDFSKLNDQEKIGLASHLNFLHCLLEDFFFFDDEEEFDDEEFEELEADEDEE